MAITLRKITGLVFAAIATAIFALCAAAQQESPNLPAPAAAPGASASVAPLHPISAVDKSATMSIPDGWNVTSSGSGMIQVHGPKGEFVIMGAMLQNNCDPGTAQGRAILQYMSKRNTPCTACPLTKDLAESYLCVAKAGMERNHKPVPTMKVISSTPIAGATPGATVSAEMDFGDERGPMTVKLQLGTIAHPGAATWTMMLYEIALPKDLATEEMPTMHAITASYHQAGEEINSPWRR